MITKAKRSGELFFHITYTTVSTRQNHKIRIEAKSKKQAIEQLLKEEPKAEIKKIVW